MDPGAWVLEVISQAYHLEFHRIPPAKLKYLTSSLSQVQAPVMDQEVQRPPGKGSD